MATTIFLELVTPDGSIFSGDVKSILAPSTNGLFQILYDHAPYITTLGTGLVTLELANGSPKRFQIQSGVAEVVDNKMMILAEKISEAV